MHIWNERSCRCMMPPDFGSHPLTCGWTR
ncbi:hypothetical protein D8B25_19345 [Verminephrobacter aporrectodeae subsp. tuberculatae]|nr:hypothetical protein [Verminephrobacter aporrectodeae subsp. tuberculatae]MCW8171409.1 hypothetical protein [Verminephrobacter aporrectodeae subsp. tuberculatae]MCW8177447.1 hypothetical protein [Verminephrobacter aporrectodeae subsp. tuberculatae]MCW8204896.1 hypothetical protein [Verminephrobacter aporrectodeae subsp. tuberculatae]